jgi:pimeloyl-ACP methyl ester carboxylesterase
MAVVRQASCIEKKDMGSPTWFGKADCPLFGVAHIPDDGCARGAVVICQPIGKEQINTDRSVKQLTEKLCAAGLLVLRFDYAGMGDASGTPMAPDAVRRWCDSIVEAVNYVRACGVAEVALVGLRLGALLAAATAARCGELCSLVLWDPVVSGRTYLREARALYQRNTDEPGASAHNQVPLLETVLHEAAVAELSALTLDQSPAHTLDECYVLCAVRGDARDQQHLQRAIKHLQADALLLDANQTEFVAPPSSVSALPSASIKTLVMRIASVFGSETIAVHRHLGDTVTHTSAMSGGGGWWYRARAFF